MAKKLKEIIFDIDGTICEQCEGDYQKLKPYKEAVDMINLLYDEGYKIIFYTSRFMGRCNGDVLQVYKTGYEFTYNQLKDWGIRFHELWMGKPRGDIIIDDKSAFFKNDWKNIYEECKKI
jgi:hypothetical protein